MQQFASIDKEYKKVSSANFAHTIQKSKNNEK